MDQDTVVSELTESGKRLIDALAANGFDVQVAFWAKPADSEKWYLYLASPVVDEKGSVMAYRHVFEVLDRTPNLWIDHFDIKVLRVDDSVAEAALAEARRKGENGTRNKKSGARIQNPYSLTGAAPDPSGFARKRGSQPETLENSQNRAKSKVN